jgi:hypothetical protein
MARTLTDDDDDDDDDDSPIHTGRKTPMMENQLRNLHALQVISRIKSVSEALCFDGLDKTEPTLHYSFHSFC